MKRIVILGAGTGGTILANKLVRSLPSDWSVVVVDSGDVHLYQPGLTYVPFEGPAAERRMVRPRGATLRPGVTWLHAEVTELDLTDQRIELLPSGELGWDLLVIATGARLRPDLMPGLVGQDERRDVFDLYTLGGAQALRHRLESFHEGRFVVGVSSGPIKAPNAPIEALFLADELLRKRGDRHRVDLVLATPHEAVFPHTLANLLEQKQILVETNVLIREIDREGRRLFSAGNRATEYDLLAMVPPHSGAAFLERAGFARGWVPTHPATLEARELPGVFVLGDATDLPTPKLGSVAHYEAELLADNLLRQVQGRPPLPTFDGHASSFIEIGDGRAMLLDRDYAHAPAPGRLGWFRLLEQSRLAHFGKRGFPLVYWNVVLPGRPLPLVSRSRPSVAPLL